MLSSTPVSPSFGVLSRAEHFSTADRRKQGVSERERAATILRRAAYYLLNEQANERSLSAHATLDAIRMIARAGRQIALEERRMPARHPSALGFARFYSKQRFSEQRGHRSQACTVDDVHHRAEQRSVPEV